MGGGSSMPLFRLRSARVLLPLGYMCSALTSEAAACARVGDPVTMQVRRRTAHIVFASMLFFVVGMYVECWHAARFRVRGHRSTRLQQLARRTTARHGVRIRVSLAGVLGCFRFPVSRAGLDFRFLRPILAFLVYFALTGNRFSSFYLFSSFFLLRSFLARDEGRAGHFARRLESGS